MSGEIDTGALESWLRREMPGRGEGFAVERVAGGQSNPTFFLMLGAERLVLRKQPPGELLPSAHAIDREFRVMRALGGTGVPVPEVVLYCDDREVIGTPFYLMRRVEGRVFHEARLPGVEPEERRVMYASLARTLAALHNVDPDAVGLGDYGRQGGYFARQIARWTKQWNLSRQGDNADIEYLIDWLPGAIPEDNATAISHGDYRVGNVMFHPARPEVAAVLDWELSTLGHPLADLAHFCIAWHSGPDEYGGLRGLDLAAMGLPEQAAFEDAYGAEARHGLGLGPFHIAFALFRFAVVFEGIAARAKAGTAADPHAGQHAHLAKVFARAARAALDG
ncbi:phosphotransferase family protein [Ostreiculturibacter nitratireducens]|uniref:phosphotransferase family protein n=1 Tax=Ostreiculturibacter nitratireducens TaxID=3075226 RepID=UPI0031B58D0F